MDLLAQDMATNARGTVDGTVFLRDAGRQAIINTVNINYNNKHFQFKPGVCVYKVESLIFQKTGGTDEIAA